ncbi:putative urea ABC transporter substrate-binding protein [Oceanobacter mangrovi]|uniref:putative urea ABC transporter substrate-binding protein n=1 Tax=Oceanobacter mangrovi TaxID=2862510 RepID=UPI001C8D6E1B|nr:putative urea ABC transporter substrate-binding protein [Oceanobacter mangrovi]
MKFPINPVSRLLARTAVGSAMTAAMTAALAMASPAALAKDQYRIAWTIYAGSVPLGYAEDKGILDKWGERYGIDITAVQLNDYIEAQTQFAAGEFDAVIAISLDALTIPAASGVDTTALMLMSNSAGSDGIIVRDDIKTMADLKGKSVNLVELTGSHYLMARALSGAGMSEKDVSVVNTSDADIGSVFGSPDTSVVVTWKPQLSTILEQYPNTHVLFDSAQLPGEIVDVMAVHTNTLQAHPELGKAIAGAWYEVVDMLDANNPKHKDLMEYSAAALQTSVASVEQQLSTIDFYSPASAAAAVQSPQFASTMKFMSEFAFEHGLLGDGAPDAGFVGIEMGDGSVLGNADNIQLRFPVLQEK